jgi:uncharacterized protein YlxW (UPF0749 family)
MKLNETSVFVFIAALSLGLLISLNINFNRNPSAAVLSAQQYRDAYNLRQKLRKDITNLNEQYYNNYSKLVKYKDSNSSYQKILKEISDELELNKLILGSTEVVGEGILITLEDGELVFENTIEAQLTNWERLIHDKDIRITITNLRNAGARAISINGIRVINTSSFICAGEFILVDGVKHAAPYYICAIGNKEVLMNYMTGSESHLKFMEYFRQVKVSVDKQDNIRIPAYIGNMNHKHMVKAQG